MQCAVVLCNFTFYDSYYFFFLFRRLLTIKYRNVGNNVNYFFPAFSDALLCIAVSLLESLMNCTSLMNALLRLISSL